MSSTLQTVVTRLNFGALVEVNLTGRLTLRLPLRLSVLLKRFVNSRVQVSFAGHWGDQDRSDRVPLPTSASSEAAAVSS